MRYRKLSPTGDYTFGNGQLDFLVNSPEAVAQVIETSLRLFLGEWYLNQNSGMPWLQQVMGYNSKEDADNALIAYILTLEGVQNLDNWESTRDPATRKYTSISATVDTIYGATDIELQNLGVT
jgi:hypothetical protein